jgi:hypothetical protein
MPRPLDTATLEQAARDYAGFWLAPDRKSPSGKVYIDGPSRVLQDFRNFDFDDEFAFLMNSDAGIKAWLGGKALADFERRAKEELPPRDEKLFVEKLRRKLAVDPDGNHIPGCRGTTIIGTRIVGRKLRVLKTRKWGELLVPKHECWPVYAGEPEERALGNSKAVDPLPEGAEPWPLEELHATNPNISVEAAMAALDALLARLDEGSGPATIRGRTGSQPADPDAAESGTLLFTLTMSDPAFGAAVDISPGARATAGAIADDSSADATGTLGYCRVGATGTGADDHIDGSVGTSNADFIFNTLSIVAGAVVSMSSFTVTLPQGATAT